MIFLRPADSVCQEISVYLNIQLTIIESLFNLNFASIQIKTFSVKLYFYMWKVYKNKRNVMT